MQYTTINVCYLYNINNKHIHTLYENISHDDKFIVLMLYCLNILPPKQGGDGCIGCIVSVLCFAIIDNACTPLDNSDCKQLLIRR